MPDIVGNCEEFRSYGPFRALPSPRSELDLWLTARSRPQIINGPELKSSIDTFLLHLWVSQVDSVLGPSGSKTGT